MGDSKLCLLLLLSTSALAYAQDDDQPTCQLAKRYNTLHKYEYQYEAESLNAISGASELKNGPKASCKVEIEVPQTCSFIVRTTGCRLSEVVDMDTGGNPVFAPSPSSDAFAAEMERYPLKVVVEGVYDVKLYPEDGETTTILNIKRGIISALAVPLLEEDKNKLMPTIHGKCKTSQTVNSRENIATDITLNRDLSRCDKFVPMRDHTSPLALISGMHYPLAQLIRSSQTCNYQFNNRKKHMTSGSCTEKHILIPFSHKGEYGVTNVGKQELTLVKVSPHNDRVFHHSGIMKELHMEAVEDKSVVQDKDAVLHLLRELTELSETDGERRAHLFHRLITMVRGMKTETLRSTIPEALAVSRLLTYQVLAQCGTPECSSGIMQILQTFNRLSLKFDAGVFAMGLVSNPSSLLINDMLEMAKSEPSKPIMYALSNVVKRFYKAEGKQIPEIYSVAEFMAAQLGDCSGGNDRTFMTLRVIGNMAPAVLPVSPALRAAVIRCVNQPAVDPVVQQAAIQVYRLTRVPKEGREVLMQVLLATTSPIQKRIAAYLVLMKDPQPTELAQFVHVLTREKDQQLRSFVESHLINIISSTEPETAALRQMIGDALQDNEIGPIMDPTKFSRNYKMGSLEGNVIFEGTSYLPKEVMLEMTLKAFGYDIEMLEIGMEGKGFEPTVEALFGKNGFFPDTALKTMYYVTKNMPLRINEILQNMIPALEGDKIKTRNLMGDIGHNLNKLAQQMKTADAPDAMVCLRILGNELGYLRTEDMERLVYAVASIFEMFPTDLMKALSNVGNTIFAHYIFMDNEFFLPTVIGVPLRIALSGIFTPGIKSGLKVTPDMSEISFMPSAGVEFVTQIGSYIPEYVSSGLEMNTNIFHESGLLAKISMRPDSVKLTIPAPKSATKLIKMTNNLVAVTGSARKPIPPTVTDKVDVSKCTPVFAGMRYCAALQYVDASSQDTAPYFPFTGDSKFVLELQPTGDITEYTASIAYELLGEGEQGRQKVDSVKFLLRAEGVDPTEARAVMKYNRKKNTVTADIQIPDYDVEAGIRVGVVDGTTKGKGTRSISLDFVYKNIPQLSLVGRANLKATKEGMLQMQLLVPSIDADATVTAKMKRGEEMDLELKSEVKVMGATSKQKIKMKYDSSKIQAEFKSDVNTDTSSLPNSDIVMKYGNEILDVQVGQPDMKVRHIFKKFVEATNNYMEMYGSDIPYFQNLRVPHMPETSLPETLFLNTEAKAVYHFNNEHYTIAIPFPLGGKSAEELKFPLFLSTADVRLPEIGLEIVSMKVPIPRFVVPESLILSIPLFGKAEVSTLVKNNLYNMEASMTLGKDVVETPSYSAKFDVRGTSPIDILSVKFEGSGTLVTADSLKAQFKSSLAHKFFETSISIVEEASLTDKLNLRSTSRIEAVSPFGLNFELVHTGMTGIYSETLAAHSSFKGMFQAGPMHGKTVSTQYFTILPFRRVANVDSFVDFNSTIVQVKNTISASFTDGEFSAVSNTNVFEDVLTSVAMLSFKDSKLSLKWDTKAFALGMQIRNQAEASAGAGEVLMKMETNADHSENLVYSLVTAILNDNGLVVNSDATVKLFENEAIHKATLNMNKNGLMTSGTTTLQSPLTLENTFSAGFDASRAVLSIANKAAMHDMKFDNNNTLTITLSSLDFSSIADATARDFSSYVHEIMVNMKPYTASVTVKHKINLLMSNIINEAVLQVEPSKMDLSGNVKAAYGDEEIKHSYQVNFADMTANAKCSTNGKFLGTNMSHNTELEVVGLAARITNDVRFSSQPMRFDHTIRCSIVPFDFNLDAIFNADGDMVLYGNHSGQLFGKVLLKVQPLTIASSHECRASLTQQLDNGFALKTTFDNKIDNILSLLEQKTNFRIQSKVNEHALVQHFSVYNTAESAGIEASGMILTNILNRDSTVNQEFNISGFVKYDKNTDSHIFQFPLMENLPAFLESIKGMVVAIAEAVQDYIKNKEIIAKLEALPDHLSEFISQVNFEGHLIQVAQFFDDSLQYTISMKDVEASLRKLQVTVAKAVANLKKYIQNIIVMMKEIIVSGALPDTLIQKIIEFFKAFNEEYNIKTEIVYALDTMREMIEDLKTITVSSIGFLSNIDEQYRITNKLLLILRDLKFIVEHTDLQDVVNMLRQLISFCFIIFRDIINDLYAIFPTEILWDIQEYIIEIIEELDILGTTEAGYVKIRELIVNFGADKKVQAILQNAVELIKKFRVEENIRNISKVMKDIPGKLLQAIQSAINYLKTTEVRHMIEELNMNIETVVGYLKSLHYNDFVIYANECISRYTNVHSLIRSLEISKKLKATINFVNLCLSSARGYMEHLREYKTAEIAKSLKDIIDQLVFENLRDFAEVIKRKITDFDINTAFASFKDYVSKQYKRFIAFATNIVNITVDLVYLPPQLNLEIRRIIYGISHELKKGELNIPTFVIPFTDLVVPSWKFSMSELQQIKIPAQLEIPTFTILNYYTVNATTISINNIKQKIIQLIDYFANIKIRIPDMDAFFGDMTMNFLPSMPEITFPAITIPEISFPTIPQVPVEKLVKSLEVPEIKLPTISSEIVVPCFGKLYGEFTFHTPIYRLKTSAEIQNTTESEMTPTFTGFLTSETMSQTFDILNYKLDSTALIAFPKMSRIVLAEMFKLYHPVLGVQHQASLIIYGLSAQAQAKTAIKVITSPYSADFTNIAFIAIEGGMLASLDTNYTHSVNLSAFDVIAETTVKQKAVVHQHGHTITLTVDNSGKGKFNAEDRNHKSNIHLSLTPSIVTLSFSGDTDSALLRMKQKIVAEFGIFSYFKFKIRNEAEAPVIKKSLFVASGQGSFYDMRVALKANHDTEMYGALSGILSSQLNIVVQPTEFVFEFQNKGNAKVDIFETLPAKVNLQNDYSAIFKPDSQEMNTVALVRLNQYKVFYNFTLDNNENEAAFFVAMESEVDLDFLRSPISIPEIYLPFVDFRTPAVSDLNLYEQMALKNILTTTEQTVNVDAKIVYQKSQAAPLVDMMGMIQIPLMGNLITELSVKSAIINLNVNTEMFTEDDFVVRLTANTASVFESLKAKLDGTTSLTTKRGIKLANSLSLENRHIEGTHDSTMGISAETFDVTISVSNVAKIALPILSLEASQNLVADTKTKANTIATFSMKGDFNIPVIKAVGKASAEYSLKLDGTFDYVSMESATNASMDGTILEDYLVFGILDNYVNLYLNKDGLRSTSKVITNGHITNRNTKVLSMDVNENLAVEASLHHVYVLLKYTGNNEANLFNFITNGKHVAQATIDFAPISPFTADIDISISQPSSLGDLTFFVKNAADMASIKQKISSSVKFVSPVYVTNLEAVAEGNAPVFKITIKSSATSVILFLDYDMDVSSTAIFENEALNVNSKAVLKHADLNMDVNHVIMQSLRRKRQLDNSSSIHTLNVGITSHTFTDVSLSYASDMDLISGTVSCPAAGVLSLQINRIPSQMSARVYGRYPSAPADDVDILIISSSSMDADKMRLQISYNMEAPSAMLSGLRARMPSIISAFTQFAQKYQITRDMEQLKIAVVDRISEVYNTAIFYDVQMSQLSIFFRNIIVQYQKIVQVFLDAAITFLREFHFKLPGSDELTTIPDVIKKLTSSIATMMDMTIQTAYNNMEFCYNSFVEKISSVKLGMPVGDVITGNQLLNQIKTTVRNIFEEMVDFVKNMESLDIILVKIGETLKVVVEKSQVFVDSIQSDCLDAVLVNVNVFYGNIITYIKNVGDHIAALNVEQINNAFEYVIDLFIDVVEQLSFLMYAFLLALDDVQTYATVRDGRLEIDLPFSFQQ